MYYVVTGAAGFIGANIVKALNARGETRIIAVDNLTRAHKFKNLAACTIMDYLDKQEFLNTIRTDAFDGAIDAVFHQGACSDTMEGDGRYMMENNYRYSVSLLNFCQERDIAFLYASSGAIYGSGEVFSESPEHESPLNIYGYSKLLFDQHVRLRQPELSAQVVGLRYFNVYGPHEEHKGQMASVVFHFFHQYREQGRVRLFEGSGGYGDGEQRRDFIFVEDVVRVNLFFLDHPELSGIFNVGTGRAEAFNNIAAATVNCVRAARGEPTLSLEQMRRDGIIEYVTFPAALQGKYQNYTQADIRALRAAGYERGFLAAEHGVAGYVEYLLRSAG
jgi:ADP-L-glycero-D-manno-heptose 6-epimerase